MEDGIVVPDDYSINDTWAGMEKVSATGKTKAIGVRVTDGQQRGC